MKKIQKQLEKLENDIRDFFDVSDSLREKSLKISRDVTRLSAKAIKKIHQGDMKESMKLLNEAKRLLVEAKKNLKCFPEILYAGFIHNAEKELIEGFVFFELVRKNTLFVPDFDTFDKISWLHGLSEAMGELRRYILDCIRKDQIEKIEQLLSLMDDVYYFLSSFDYPDMLSRNLRRNVDALRGILERTRADVTLICQQKQLERKLENR
jgi:translin